MKFLSRIKNPGFFICFYQSFLLYLPSLMIYNMKTLMKNHKTAMYCLKYIPVIMFLSMWGYTILAVIGVDLIITDIVVGCSILPSILIFALSDVFHFCWIHKCLTGYSLLVDILININKYIGLGALLLPLKTLFAIIGLGLFITLLFKNKLKKNGV